jgi:hypothetical protein
MDNVEANTHKNFSAEGKKKKGGRATINWKENGACV